MGSGTVPTQDEPQNFNMKILGDLKKQNVLLVVSGPAGQAWGKGASLGEQIGGVYVNKVSVRLNITISRLILFELIRLKTGWNVVCAQMV
jgi:hypothetical protein